LRVNNQIRADKIRVIGSDGKQVGVMSVREAILKAELEGLDLVEISPNATPPVCRIIDYGKFRYQQTKKEKESKKSQHVVKVKEIKFKPNIDQNDLRTKLKHAREFLLKGNKVRVTCTFRGREMLHSNIGEQLLEKVVVELEDVSQIESPKKNLGRVITLVLAPVGKKKK